MVAAIESFWGHLLAFLRFGVPQSGCKDRPPLFVGSVLGAYIVETCTVGISRDQDGTVRQDGGGVLSTCECHGLLRLSPANSEVKTDDTRSFDVAPGFSIQAVGELRGGELHKHKEHHGSFLVAGPKVDLPKSIIFHPDTDPSLGKVMDKFVGTFGEVRLENDFLPTSGFGTDTSKDNLLQINLTSEKLQFIQGRVLGKISNRGFQPQANVVLTGIPYQQAISDRLNKDSGRADLRDLGAIHFEQGLLLSTPATDWPKNPATISRLASIPHGTAFTAQDVETQSNDSDSARTATIGKATGGPKNMTDKVVDKTIRESDNLKRFRATGVLTLTGVNNPNWFLQTSNTKKKFLGDWAFTVKTGHLTLGDGGVSNTAFLADGNKMTVFPDAVKRNANATDVTCQYWVSIVKHKVEIQPGDYTHKDATDLLPTDNLVDVPGPRFHIQAGKQLSAKTIDLFWTQIQYSQNVRLDFGKLARPHVSVATLAPELPILVPSTHPACVAL
ncbi:hypothetical protein G647_06242 [Cladophialophora carrionii CBS 160.54]|uniref:Uncharacterized protein n=1 Tax=Cladophialophora carrionii CBS 160.54 TaxID=1279043 RepID=V9D5J0_9EURO|nr:uncharacterized protein G647_06242 [Cladophialophora carrionii CBS 160.54]ETI22169.1 hypothetical protein G647_06242 [Cladophialophora carrionii CBS 160.54]